MEEDGGPKSARPLNPRDRSSRELTETEAACTGCACVYTRFFAYILWLLVWCVYGIPDHVSEWVSCLFCLVLVSFLPDYFVQF